jgi:alkaline phosphatase D
MNKSFTLFLVLVSNLIFAQDHLLPSRSTTDASLAPFYHGVASGDPLTDRIILWTRVTTQDNSISVEWQIATDTAFANVINSGTVTTDPSKDHTVKVDATGLQQDTWYYYRFKNNGIYSPTGRTRTAPSGNVNNLRFAVVACSNYQDGFFNAYKDIALKNDVDAVIHLGDYYYEYGTDDFTPGVDSARLHEPPTEIYTLAMYRMRHSQYKMDDDLRRLHQMVPFITVWDDHESANDSWSDGAQNHTDSLEGNWNQRKSDSRKAYFEWMPIRDVHNSVDTIHRTLQMGNLLDLIMIDSRLEGRQQQIGTTGAAVTDTNRTMLGSAQLAWFKQQLSTSTAKWKLIGNQVMVSPLKVLGQAVNQDQWDGYPAERTKILSHIGDNNIDNVVFLTGDIHTSWASDIAVNPANYTASTGAGSTCVEYVCTSITSGSFITFSVPVAIIQSFNNNIKYAELSKRGYLLLDVTPQRVQGDWVYVSTITSRSFTATTAASWCDLDGENHLSQCGSALTPRNNLPVQPPFISGINNVEDNVAFIGCYPNPTAGDLNIQYYLQQPGDGKLSVTSLDGKIVKSISLSHSTKGLYNAAVSLHDVASGNYIINVQAGKSSSSRRIIKQ